MKKFAATLLAVAAFGASAAFADTIVNSYTNTIVVTYPNGAVARYHFNADNTFTATTPSGTINGTFDMQAGQICLTPAGGSRECTEVAADKNVGDTWTQQGTDGSTITVSLEAGR
ncbi:hypothetical protein U91I_02308 [alpha proteobacterium U9-1i]|nr:hypothetical protein U91I_02308 [alpha proteobacterium U9-1i]